MFREGKLCGKGYQLLKNGEEQHGFFFYNLLNGDGKVICADQEIQEGEFQNGKLHG